MTTVLSRPYPHPSVKSIFIILFFCFFSFVHVVCSNVVSPRQSQAWKEKGKKKRRKMQVGIHARLIQKITLSLPYISFHFSLPPDRHGSHAPIHAQTFGKQKEERQIKQHCPRSSSCPSSMFPLFLNFFFFFSICCCFLFQHFVHIQGPFFFRLCTSSLPYLKSFQPVRFTKLRTSR